MNPFATGALGSLLNGAPRGIEEQHRLGRKSPLEIAREFEALLVAQVIGAMRKTVASTGLFGGDSAANKVLDGAFDTELARNITKNAKLGLAEQLAAQIEHHEHAAAPLSGTALDPVTPGDGDGVAAPRDDGRTGGEPSAAENVVASQLVAGADGRVTSGFGVRRDPITGARALHLGIDVAAPRGSAIHAVAGGEVTFSGRRGKAGNVVEVRAGDVVNTYAHVQRSLVRRGQKIAVGDVLATVGSTGRSTGPHVHFAVTRDGQAVDPSTVLGSGSAAAAAEHPAPSGAEEA